MHYVKINTGINPDGNSYRLQNIKNAIKGAIGYTPWIECNVDASGNSQLYQIYLCVDTSGSSLIECPVFPQGKMWFRDWVPFLLKNDGDNHFMMFLFSFLPSYHQFKVIIVLMTNIVQSSTIRMLINSKGGGVSS